VTYVPVPFPDMATALAEHRVDAISAVEPFITSAELSNGAQPVMSICTGPTSNFPISGYFALQSWTQKHPNTAHAFQAAMRRDRPWRTPAGRMWSRSCHLHQEPEPGSVRGREPRPVPTSLNETHLNRVVSLMQTDGLVGPNFSVAPLLFH